MNTDRLFYLSLSLSRTVPDRIKVADDNFSKASIHKKTHAPPHPLPAHRRVPIDYILPLTERSGYPPFDASHRPRPPESCPPSASSRGEGGGGSWAPTPRLPDYRSQAGQPFPCTWQTQNKRIETKKQLEPFFNPRILKRYRTFLGGGSSGGCGERIPSFRWLLYFVDTQVSPHRLFVGGWVDRGLRCTTTAPLEEEALCPRPAPSWSTPLTHPPDPSPLPHPPLSLPPSGIATPASSAAFSGRRLTVCMPGRSSHGGGGGVINQGAGESQTKSVTEGRDGWTGDGKGLWSKRNFVIGEGFNHKQQKERGGWRKQGWV